MPVGVKRLWGVARLRQSGIGRISDVFKAVQQRPVKVKDQSPHNIFHKDGTLLNIFLDV